MNVIDQAKADIEIANKMRLSGNPGALLEQAVRLSAILASVNEYSARQEALHAANVVKWLEDGRTSSAAQQMAQAALPYLEYRLARGVGEAIEHLITSLRRLAEQLSKELNLTS